MAGGALLSLSYAVLIVRQAIDWQAGPTLGTPIHLPLMRTISAALVLIVGLVGLVTARIGGLGWMPVAGGLVTMAGFGLWAYAAAENFLPITEPWWWNPLLFPALVAVGSLVFGLGVFRSRAVRRRLGMAGLRPVAAEHGWLSWYHLAGWQHANQPCAARGATDDL